VSCEDRCEEAACYGCYTLGQRETIARVVAWLRIEADRGCQPEPDETSLHGQAQWAVTMIRCERSFDVAVARFEDVIEAAERRGWERCLGEVDSAMAEEWSSSGVGAPARVGVAACERRIRALRERGPR
jgi:hypothetical protein